MRALAFALLVLVACGDESTAVGGAGGGGGGGSEPLGGESAGGAPSTGGAGGAAPTPCNLYCACMTFSCSAFDGYPFADAETCLATCEAFTAEELSCFGAHCEQASTGTPTEHQCEHAWGNEGTSEC